MQKKMIATSLIIVVILLLSVSFVACNRDGITTDLAVGEYPTGLAPLLTDAQRDFINNAMTTDDEDVKKEAVMMLYTVANRSRIDTHTSLVLQESNAGNPMGDIVMHAFKLKSGDKWYYQLATQVETGNAFINEIMKAFAGFIKIGYSLGQDQNYFFSAFGAKYECNCEMTTFPYASYVIPDDETLFTNAMTDEEFIEALYCIESIFEINNMRFVKEIIADGATIAYNDEKGYYTVNFSVDMNADEELLKQWFELPAKDMAVGGQTLEYYSYYNAVLEVWNNGYAKSYTSNSSREAGMGSGDPYDKFEYIWNENEILQLLREDTRITEEYENSVQTIEDYIDYYSNPSYVTRKLTSLEIAGIVIGCIVALIIAIVVLVEVLVRAGKLPKLAAARERDKQKRLARKQAKLDANKGSNPINSDSEEVFDEVACDSDATEEVFEEIKSAVDDSKKD